MWHNILCQDVTPFEKHVYDLLAELRDHAHASRKELQAMALDLTKLNAAVTRVGTDVTALIAAVADPAAEAAAQKAVDDAAAALDASSAAAEAKLAPTPSA